MPYPSSLWSNANIRMMGCWQIIGFAEGNFMNISMSLALYATITKELGEELVFPGCERCYLGTLLLLITVPFAYRLVR